MQLIAAQWDDLAAEYESSILKCVESSSAVGANRLHLFNTASECRAKAASFRTLSDLVQSPTR